MICLISLDHDDKYEQLLMKVVKARKKFKCGECKDPIHKGDMYEVFVGSFDGIHVHRTCLTCLSIRNKFCCDWTFDGIYDDINDAIENDLKLVDCFLMQASKTEYAHLIRFVPYLDENTDHFPEEDDE